MTTVILLEPCEDPIRIAAEQKRGERRKLCKQQSLQREARSFQASQGIAKSLILRFLLNTNLNPLSMFWIGFRYASLYNIQEGSPTYNQALAISLRYQRHQPEQTLLCQLVDKYYPTTVTNRNPLKMVKFNFNRSRAHTQLLLKEAQDSWTEMHSLGLDSSAALSSGFN
ncbi:MAG: hypothetical protein RL839_08590 [Gammaproteobacteria bacterium]